MSYYLFLIETKKEYTIHLVNILAPLMYEGIASIYEDAKTNAPENEELKLFQSLLRKIPSWNDHLIEQETNRIIKLSKGDIIEDLIKAVIKSNIMILTNTPPDKKDNLRIKHDITTQKFIHNSYIEAARNVFQNPYLFYHNYDSHELKKNQRDATETIKESIRQAIRKLLPMNMILPTYIGSTYQNQTDDFQNSISDADYNKLKHMLNSNPVDNEMYQLSKKDKNQTQIQTQTQTQTQPNLNQNLATSVAVDNNGSLNVKINVGKDKANPPTSDNFKTLKDLVKQNPSNIESKANQIMVEKTEKAIRESEIIKSAKADTTTSKAETSKAETSKADTSKAETSKAETSKAETSKAETSKAESNRSNIPNISNVPKIELINVRSADKASDKTSDKKSDKSSDKTPDSDKNLKTKLAGLKTSLQSLQTMKDSEPAKLVSGKTAKSTKSVASNYDSEDASVSYFRQVNNNNFAEVYGESKSKSKTENKQTADQKGGKLNSIRSSDTESGSGSATDSESETGSGSGSDSESVAVSVAESEVVSKIKKTMKSMKSVAEQKPAKTAEKAFINYDCLNDNSSLNMKDLMGDMSSVEHKKPNIKSKQKYFNQNKL